MRAKKIKYIVIHTSAGFGDYKAMQAHWKSLGWKTGGYHRVIITNGEVVKAYDFDAVTNGVQGYNSESIHICYQGGIDRKTGKALDTRTEEQKGMIIDCINEAMIWLKDNGNDLSNVMILGHRDFSKDVNKNGKIDSFERIKECPCFDAIPEYSWMIVSKGNQVNKLPNQ